MSKPLIYLASASPRRSALLSQIGVPHGARPVHVEESAAAGEAPDCYVQRLARAKAEALWQQLDPVARLPVLGSDTTVVLDGEILGKPVDRAEGIGMLSRLSGKTHQVYTAVALRHADACEVCLSLSAVTFRRISVAECEAYWRTGEPIDKAGGYAVQGIGAVFVTRLEGSYSGVMGLPLCETAALLERIGWSLGATSGDGAP